MNTILQSQPAFTGVRSSLPKRQVPAWPCSANLHASTRTGFNCASTAKNVMIALVSILHYEIWHLCGVKMYEKCSFCPWDRWCDHNFIIEVHLCAVSAWNFHVAFASGALKLEIRVCIWEREGHAGSADDNDLGHMIVLLTREYMCITVTEQLRNM